MMKYNYNNICYKSCPNGTYPLSNNIYSKYKSIINYNISSSIILDNDFISSFININN